MDYGRLIPMKSINQNPRNSRRRSDHSRQQTKRPLACRKERIKTEDHRAYACARFTTPVAKHVVGCVNMKHENGQKEASLNIFHQFFDFLGPDCALFSTKKRAKRSCEMAARPPLASFRGERIREKESRNLFLWSRLMDSSRCAFPFYGRE